MFFHSSLDLFQRWLRVPELATLSLAVTTIVRFCSKLVKFGVIFSPGPAACLPIHRIAGSPASGGSMVDTANASQVLLGGDGISVAVATSVANSDAVNGASKGYVIEYEVVLENTGTTTLKSISVMGTVGR